MKCSAMKRRDYLTNFFLEFQPHFFYYNFYSIWSEPAPLGVIFKNTKPGHHNLLGPQKENSLPNVSGAFFL